MTNAKKPSTWSELEIQVPAPLADEAAGWLVDAGAAGAETVAVDAAWSLIRVSYVDGTRSLRELAQEAARVLGEIGCAVDVATISSRERDDQDWAEIWKQHFHPLQLGNRIWIIPAWEEVFQCPPDAIQLRMEPGMAFGTGQHATTALCAAILEDQLQEGQTLLDVGCGSGILSMIAAKLGGSRVVGIDNDPVAVEVARENSTQNQTTEEVELSTQPVAAMVDQFDWVVANILAGTLIALAPDLIRRMNTGGALVLSGILVEQQDAICRRFEEEAATQGVVPWQHQETRTEGEWVALVFRARP